MYIKVDGDKAEIVKHIEKDKPKVVCAVERMQDELEDFLKYKHMYEHDNNSKYADISMQEFQHFLIAWDDFTSMLQPLLNSKESAEFHKFVKSWSTTGTTSPTSTM